MIDRPTELSTDLPDYASRPDPLDPPVWLMLILRRVEDGTFLLVRRPEAPAPSMLSTAPPHRDEGLDAGIASLVWARLGLRTSGPARLAARAHPARMAHPYTGGPGAGRLRALAVEVSGTPEPDALIEGWDALDAATAEATLATDLERAIFRDGVALFD